QQNLIVKTRVDLEMQWKKEIESIIRLAATFLVNGETVASIDFKGENKLYRVGESIEGRKITEIGSGYMNYEYRGSKGKLTLQPIPEKPAAIDVKQQDKKEYIW
ncbi:MAG: hypothetical protein PHR06_09180, partial [Candidatus Cloacimonetes bacterium]|nr:hypothetical protein [Candidatus Cloacimonadota bacterium]